MLGKCSFCTLPATFFRVWLIEGRDIGSSLGTEEALSHVNKAWVSSLPSASAVAFWWERDRDKRKIHRPMPQYPILSLSSSDFLFRSLSSPSYLSAGRSSSLDWCPETGLFSNLFSWYALSLLSVRQRKREISIVIHMHIHTFRIIILICSVSRVNVIAESSLKIACIIRRIYPVRYGCAGPLSTG